MPENDAHIDQNAADAGLAQDLFNSMVQPGSQMGSPAQADSGSNNSGDASTSNTQQGAAPEQQDPGSYANQDGQQGNAVNPDLEGVDDPKRFSYWQSEHDRLRNEFESYKQSIEAQNPILDYINRDPAIAQKVYGVVQESLNGNGDQLSGNGSTGSALNLEKPQAPAKPDNYDAMEAVSNPESDSYKYREAKDQYIEKLAEYNEGLLSHQQQQFQERQRQEQIQRQAQDQAKQAYNEAVYRYNLQPQEASQFVQWAQNPNNVDMSTLVQIFRMNVLNKPNPQGTPAHQGSVSDSVRDLQNRNSRLQAPIPPNVNGNMNAHDGSDPYAGLSPEVAEGQAFTDALAKASGQQI